MRPTQPRSRSTLSTPALIALGALLSLVGPAAAGEVAEVARATTARADASPSAGSRGKAAAGDVYAVARARGDWVEVQFDERKAWLRKADVTVRDGAVKRITASSGLRVRSGSGANHRSLGALPAGAHVADRGGSAAWRKISFDGKTGWISARFLRAVSGGSSSVGIAAIIDGPATNADDEEDEVTPAEDGDGAEDGDDPANVPHEVTAHEHPTIVGWDAGRRLGPIEVVYIDGKPVALRTAEAYRRMRDAARRDGIALRINSGFRTYEHQAELYRLYRAGRGNLAARPGYSNHQDGKALDLNTSDPGVYRWLTRNAARFGFRRTVPSEKWHWEVR